MMTPEEIKKIVCNIVRFKRQNQPWDLETMVICVKLVQGYEGKATRILESLGRHRQNLPTQISKGVKIQVITSQIAREGGQIRRNMEDLIQDFLKKEC